MGFDTPESVVLALAFLVPGFVANDVTGGLIPREDPGQNHLLLRLLTLSCINYALFSWLLVLVGTSEYFTGHPIRTAAALFIVVFLAPVLLGVAIGVSHHFGLMRRVLQRLGLAPIHVIPTAWDYIFSTTVDSRWVIVTLSDGKVVQGWYGMQSFASSRIAERDLYIEQVFLSSGDEAWEKKPQTEGILIRADQIKSIEFIGVSDHDEAREKSGSATVQ